MRNKIFLKGFLTVSIIFALIQAGQVPSRFVLGTNFSGICDWGTEPVWNDYMKQSRTWCPQRSGMNWGEGWPLSVDSLNWINQLDAGQTADCPLFGSTSGDWTSMIADSTYLCLYDGQGTLQFSNAASFSVISPGRIQFKPNASAAPFLQITATTPTNYIKNIRIIRRDMESTYQTQPWDERFLARWHEFPVVRFMDWQSTNNSPLDSWSKRTRPNSQTQAMESGVALEYMIDYCNKTQTNPWFCIPHRVDDDFVRQFATLVKNTLDPRLKAYIEYSNECWNSMFSQTAYCDSMGTADKLDPSNTHPWEAGWRWYGRRSKQIFTIFEQVFGGTDRFIRVIASQMNSYVTDLKLSQDSVYLKTDAVAIAPYFGGVFDAAETQTTVQNWTVSQLLDSCQKDITGNVRKAIQDHLDLIAQYSGKGASMKLAAYEGGQHLVGVGGAENNQTLTDLFIAANRDPRMYDLYVQYFEQWASMGGTVFCQFSSLCSPSKWGSWCVLETPLQDTSTAPKYRALMEMIRRYPPVTRVAPRSDSRSFLKPECKIRGIKNRLRLSGISGTTAAVFSFNGRLLGVQNMVTGTMIDIPLPQGGYLVRIKQGTSSFERKVMILP
jgi:hypothetical protein